MIFNSIEFFIFFITFLFIYFSIPMKWKWLFLLIASYFFFGWQNWFTPIYLLIPTLIVYVLGLNITSTSTQKHKRKYFILGIFFGLVPLIIFKYSNFLLDSFNSLLNVFKTGFKYKQLDIILPIGISFYSFRLLSYVVDIYNEKIKPENHFGHFALYISFFPQILAGPIERAANFLPQLKRKVDLDYQRVTSGLKLMVWGFFKKIVIADQLALSVNRVYNNVNDYTGLVLWVVTLFYSIQIYCDFSGYSDIAIGISKILGFKSIENFKSPYFSTDIKQFWNRWHISLSTWLRDYLFLPIAYATMRRVPSSFLFKIKIETWGYVVGMLMTMFLGGLWHGAKWNFVLWGIIHGLFLIISYTTKKPRRKIIKIIKLKKIPVLHRWFKVFITFNMVSFAWIFFRANSIHDATYVVSHLFKGISNQIANLGLLKVIKNSLGLNELDLAIIILSIAILLIVDIFEIKSSLIKFLSKRVIGIRWAIYCLVVYYILWFGNFNKIEFIYFQF